MDIAEMCSISMRPVPYVPMPLKSNDKFGTYFNKRYRKYYQRFIKNHEFGSDSLIFDYRTVYERM